MSETPAGGFAPSAGVAPPGYVPREASPAWMYTKRDPFRSLLKFLVARTRFELVISALRGRRPKPLDERAICRSIAASMRELYYGILRSLRKG